MLNITNNHVVKAEEIDPGICVTKGDARERIGGVYDTPEKQRTIIAANRICDRKQMAPAVLRRYGQLPIKITNIGCIETECRNCGGKTNGKAIR